MHVCLVKQHGCYDLYTETGPDLSHIARSSACRSGPLGLWQWPMFATDFRVVAGCDAPECRIGPDAWAPFVDGKQFRHYRGVPEDPSAVPWDTYDIVISIDIAVPATVVRQHPSVLWCHYFVEGGPWGRDEQWADAPQYGYNVFLDHRPAARLLRSTNWDVRRLARTGRTVLNFPYYLLSDTTLASVYRSADAPPRVGICLASSSRADLDAKLRSELRSRGPLRDDYATLAELHAAMAASKYYVVAPGSESKTGGALVDAISAGCVVVAPTPTVRHFGHVTLPWLSPSDTASLLARLDALESDTALYRSAREGQAAIVRRTFWEYPLRNLELLRQTLSAARAGSARQERAERRARALVPLVHLRTKARRRLHRQSG